MTVRLVYWSLRRLLELLTLRRRPGFDRDIELIVLRHELAVLRRQIDRPAHANHDRVLLSALARVLPRDRWRSLLITPDTVMGWHRWAATWNRASKIPARTGRPRIDPQIETLACRLADENPSWGYRRIHGELARLGVAIAASTVWEILRRNRISPAPRNRESTWRRFLTTQAANIVAADFFTVDTIALKQLYVLVFIHHGTRQILKVTVTDKPNARFVTQSARNLLMALDDHAMSIRFLIRDRDALFTRDLFDTVFTSDGIDVIQTPFRAPKANAICERAIGTLRRECLDRHLIFSQAQLRRVLAEYVAHYNGHRPHRTLGQEPPIGLNPEPTPPGKPLRVERRAVLGGLINEYTRAA